MLIDWLLFTVDRQARSLNIVMCDLSTAQLELDEILFLQKEIRPNEH